MEYNRIIAITGLPGLFELLSSKTDGAIVKSLEEGTARFVSSRIHHFSHLESIEIYTQKDNVNLVEVFQSMEKSSDALPDGKDGAALKGYFQQVYPEMDFERVYASDMKKMVKWFEVLQKNKVEIKLSEAPEEEAPAVEEEAVEETPKKKAATKKAVKEPAAEKEPAAKKEAAAEKPKKAATKTEKAKTDSETAEKPKKAAKKKKED